MSCACCTHKQDNPPMSSPPTPASPFEALKSGFRRACVRKLVGDENAAIVILRDEIPGLVANWAKASDLSAAEKKAKLKEIFDDESARADELATAFDLFASRFEVRVAELVRRELSTVVQKVNDSINALIENFEFMREIVTKLSSSNLCDSKEPGAISSGLYKENVSAIPDSGRPMEIELSDGLLPVSSDEDPSLPDIDNAENEVLSKDVDLIVKSAGVHASDHSHDEEGKMVGLGLRFDEIEEMIDEILSSPTQ